MKADQEISSPDDGMLSVKQFCTLYGVSHTTVYEELATGRLRAVKVGRKTLVPRSNARAWQDSLPPLRLTQKQVALILR